MANILTSKIQVPSLPNDTLILKDAEARQDLSTALATVTGNPLNFSTRSAQKANETVISLEPIQDLHGYDHPWPAGGGKNKCSVSSVNLGGSDARSKYLVIENLPAGTYTLSYTNVGNAVAFFQLPNSGTTGSYRSGATFITTNNETQLYAFISQTDYDNGKTAQLTNLQIESGNQQTSFAPYSNICPIDGRTETSLVGCGKNELQVTATSRTVNGVTYTVNDDGTVTTNGTAIVKTSYFVLTNSSNDLDDYQNAIFKSGDRLIFTTGITNNLLARNTDGTYRALNNDEIITLEKDIGLVYIHYSLGLSANETFKPMIRLASNTDATYEPFIQSNNLTIQFGEKVYGATVELEKGTVTVEWGYIAEYNGETLPGEWISDRDVYAPNTSPSTGAEVVYKLAAPRTITLTPNEISLLKGVNNISTDGDSIKLTYRDGKVATLGDLDEAANNLQEQIDQNETMEDETTQLLYKLGVNNGLLFMEEV